MRFIVITTFPLFLTLLGVLSLWKYWAHRSAAKAIEAVLNALQDNTIAIAGLDQQRAQRDLHSSWENFWAMGWVISLTMGICCFEFTAFLVK
jgi:hypothetical protein